MQFLLPPGKGQIRDSAHAVDIYLAVHTEIPLKLWSGTLRRSAAGVGHFQPGRLIILRLSCLNHTSSDLI